MSHRYKQSFVSIDQLRHQGSVKMFQTKEKHFVLIDCKKFYFIISNDIKNERLIKKKRRQKLFDLFNNNICC
jgi:hypothetical protein